MSDERKFIYRTKDSIVGDTGSLNSFSDKREEIRIKYMHDDNLFQSKINELLMTLPELN